MGDRIEMIEENGGTGAAAPAEMGGIANFGWVAPGRLARGEQPRQEWGGYEALRDAGVTCLLSLREAEERRNTVAGRPFPAYRAADEAAACLALGLRFRHLPFVDRTVPPAEDLAAALRLVEEELAAGQVVYVHCMAGIGRTGLVAALWLLMQGASGDAAAEHFARYWREYGEREDAVLGPQPDAILERYGFPLQWWALMRIAEALGVPITGGHDGARPQPPGDAEAWLAACRRHIAPLRERRR